jgi:hypothetical protein
MTANAYNNSVRVAREAMKHLESSIVVPHLCNRQYDKLFKAGGDIGLGGSTAYARIPGRYETVQSATATPNGYNDTVKAIQVLQYNTSARFTTAELALNLDDPNNNLLPSLMESLASAVDVAMLAPLVGVYQVAGAAGTAITSHAPFLEANAILDEANALQARRFAVLNPRAQGKMLGAATSIFNPQAELGEQYASGRLGRAFGLDWYMSQHLGSQTVGPLGGSPAVGTAVEGASTLPTTAWTASAAARLSSGDVFTIAGVYKVDPITGLSTGQLQQFRVTSAFSSDGSGNGTINITPSLTTVGPTASINTLPTSGALLTIASGTANSVAGNSYVMQEDALVMVSCPLAPGGPKSHQVFNPRLNMSLRVSEFWDGTADTHLTRFDVICGSVLAQPRLACRVLG